MPEGMRGASLGLARQALQREDPALGRADGRVATGPAIGAAGADLLDDGVPAAAGFALALPAVVTAPQLWQAKDGARFAIRALPRGNARA